MFWGRRYLIYIYLNNWDFTNVISLVRFCYGHDEDGDPTNVCVKDKIAYDKIKTAVPDASVEIAE